MYILVFLLTCIYISPYMILHFIISRTVSPFVRYNLSGTATLPPPPHRTASGKWDRIFFLLEKKASWKVIVRFRIICWNSVLSVLRNWKDFWTWNMNCPWLIQLLWATAMKSCVIVHATHIHFIIGLLGIMQTYTWGWNHFSWLIVTVLMSLLDTNI